ncbi:MAG: tyrosine-type recombinase/integrase [Clostridia bacterium]|nr:tyrosine-type recombinase/integrase [Clostridia bacterium]
MASLVQNRNGGKTHAIVYHYWTLEGVHKIKYESYKSIDEAIARKALLDDLQEKGLYREITAAAMAYAEEKMARRRRRLQVDPTKESEIMRNDTTLRLYSKPWLDNYATRKGLAPETIASYHRAFNLHILPILGDRLLSTITSLDIDLLITQLHRTPCTGSMAYNKESKDIPMLGTATISRTINVFMLLLKDAHKYGIIHQMPVAEKAKVKTKSRKAWEQEQITDFLNRCANPLLHLIVHLTYIGSLRPGEAAGITVQDINLEKGEIAIKHTIQRVEDDALDKTNKEKIIQRYEKQNRTTKTTLIMKEPKTERSNRTIIITAQLQQEVERRLAEIEGRKEYWASAYNDYGLLICYEDGTPIDPKHFNELFKDEQKRQGIAKDDQIDFYALRKTGQMCKLRLSNNDYQLVAAIGGHTPKILMNNYNEALAQEKIMLARRQEAACYGGSYAMASNDEEYIIERMKSDPELVEKIKQMVRQE